MHIQANNVIAQYQNNPAFQFQLSPYGLHSGVCPQCGSRSLFLSSRSPKVLKCTRIASCGYQEKIRG